RDEMFEITPKSIEPPDDQHIILAEGLEHGGETWARILRPAGRILVHIFGGHSRRCQGIPLQVERLGAIIFGDPCISKQRHGSSPLRLCRQTPRLSNRSLATGFPTQFRLKNTPTVPVGSPLVCATGCRLQRPRATPPSAVSSGAGIL